MTEEIGTETEELEVESDDVGEAFEGIAEKAETAEETARAVWEELQAKADAEEKPADPNAPPPAQKADEERPDDVSEAARKLANAKKNKKRQTFVPAPEAPAAGEKYEPPQSWEVKDKEWFHAQPPEVQKNAVTWFKNAQAQTTKVWQELAREREAVKEINSVVETHWKDLNIPSNISKAAAINQLFEYQKRINEDDVGALVEMMRYRGLSLDDLAARLNGQTQPRPRQQVQQQPQNNGQVPLTAQDIDRILEERESRLNQQRTIESATEEVRSLQREMQNGRYVWPEMHSAENIQRIQPLISYIRETNPTLPWGELYKRAIIQDRANRGVASPSPSGTRLNQQSIQTVRQASSSLRSRGGNGAIPRMSEPKANETARESAEAAYWEIFGNKQN